MTLRGGLRILGELCDPSSPQARPHRGAAVTGLGNLNAMGVVDPEVAAARWTWFWDGKTSNQNSPTHAEPWHWLGDHGVPRSEIQSCA